MAWLFVVALLVYNLNFQRIASGDTVAATLLPFSIWMDGSVTADRFYPYLQEHLPGQTLGFHLKDGRAYSGYPIAVPLLLAPLYAPVAWAVSGAGWNAARIIILAAVLEKAMASLVASLSVAVFFLLARRLTTHKRALLTTLAYGFATETWAISSQALWQHGAGELAMVAALYGLVRFWEQPGRRAWLAAAGAGAGLAAAIRPTNVLLLVGVAAWLAVTRRGARDWAAFCGLPAILGAATVAYNAHVFGSALGGNAPAFDAPLWFGLGGILASPGRGLLVYTPLFLFSVAGARICWKRRTDFSGPVWLVSAVFSVLLVLVAGKWRVWWGGHCWGPRLLTDAVPCLVVLLIPALDWVAGRRARRWLFGAALAVSVTMQFLGAFCYPASRWDETPVAIGRRPMRLWDWRDSPFTRSLRTGPRIGPDRAALPLIRKAF